ncbi:MAG: translation initiation factor IF-3 [Candidatus Omnitrophota bacterium]
MVGISKGVRINEQIRIKEIRLIGADGEQMGIMPPAKALEIAREKQLDLVEVAPQAAPPVCRVMDYSKYKYEQNKREKEARRKQHVMHIKEIRMSPKIETHDYQVKLKHLREFIERGDKVKVSMRFRGREITHLDIGKRLLDKLVKDIEDIGALEQDVKKEGRTMLMVIRPK